jgi:hypothetical protein
MILTPLACSPRRGALLVVIALLMLHARIAVCGVAARVPALAAGPR